MKSDAMATPESERAARPVPDVSARAEHMARVLRDAYFEWLKRHPKT